MDLARILDELGYSKSPHFLRRGEAALRTAPEFGHVFRKATSRPCNLEGLYTLRRNPDSRTEPLVPVVYVCRTDSDETADEIHRLVWNQDIVPFLLVHSPSTTRLYSGFRFQQEETGTGRGLLKVLRDLNDVSELAECFHADAIDSGKLWREYGHHVTPGTRVDWKLLNSLQHLDRWLRKHGGLRKDVSHALIGKYVYLHYLRDRGILSDPRLNEWGLDPSKVFGEKATRAGLKAVIEKLDGWLNGSVFPLELRGSDAPTDRVISRVAAAFHGDEVLNEDEWQFHLDFRAYDFSYIPIETLSVIYEQFLHSPADDGSKTKGEDAAAYYTPIPVVNFMLSEMDERLPLKRGMKVFDPACGSGAFLVQSYRQLIEREFPNTKKKPTPQELRELLESHIFGVDNDPDACGVTELSLILTLLDYVHPPDLLPASPEDAARKFKLPSLRDKNIFHTNFFKLKKVANDILTKMQFDWIVGNPPWKDLDPAKLIEQDEPVWEWISDKDNRKTSPCGGNDVAQAFSWKVCDFLSVGGGATLLVPAMTLFEDRSRQFRSQFFSRQRVTAVANFSNLAEDLFDGRSRVPAAAFFFGNRDEEQAPSDEFVTVFSPLVANQEITRPASSGDRTSTWCLLTIASEIRQLMLADVSSGSGLPWKIAIWGAASDRRLLARVTRMSPTLKQLEKSGTLIVSEGLQLRNRDGDNHKVDSIPEVAEQPILNIKTLAKLRHIFAFPDAALEKVPADKTFCRKGRGELPLSVCRPPHVIVSAARTFAVFTDQYLIVPPRQIGIVSTTDNVDFLKALSLYLSSDFVFYHQFLTSTEFGVKRDRATLNSLRTLPIPFSDFSNEELKSWVNLHARLLKTTPVNVRDTRLERSHKQRNLFDDNEDNADLDSLLKELNNLVYQALGLNDRERALVHDLVRVRLELNDGKVGQLAVRKPKTDQLKTYARRLKKDLDAFIGEESDKRHQVAIVHDDASGMIQVDLIADRSAARDIIVVTADKPTAKELETTRKRLREQHHQWVYFDRNLRIYEGTKTYILKPLQRFHWTESQAMQDASEIIAETLQLGGDAP